jgi:hypothetical protein
MNQISTKDDQVHGKTNLSDPDHGMGCENCIGLAARSKYVLWMAVQSSMSGFVGGVLTTLAARRKCFAYVLWMVAPPLMPAAIGRVNFIYQTLRI